MSNDVTVPLLLFLGGVVMLGLLRLLRYVERGRNEQ